LRASRRMAAGTAEQAAILRDAPLRCGAPQDEVGNIFSGRCLIAVATSSTSTSAQ
jgi:hypothetical protein